MGSIFISYRRQDTAAYAGRLYDRLMAHFDASKIFMDIDSIDPGADFVAVLTEKMRLCDVLLVVLGPDWVSICDANGNLRLSDPKDFVRQEVAMGLERKIHVIPLLVGGAKMPVEDELPQAISALTRRQAVVISDNYFHRDVDALIQTLHKIGLAVSDKVEITGDWHAEVKSHTGQIYEIEMRLEQLNDRIFGWVRYPTGKGGILDGRLEGNMLSFKTEHVPQFEQNKATIHFQGEISGQEIEFIMQSADSFAKFGAKKTQT